jgi:two-component system response regulator AtoC
LPDLRSRPEDVPLLLEHFIARSNGRLGTDVRGLNAASRKALMNYSYPGNVRELENIIERAVVLAEGELIALQDLPEHVRQAPDAVQTALSADGLSIKKASRTLESTLIRRALERSGGNRTVAAKLLEISHRALLYKIKDYKIDA